MPDNTLLFYVNGRRVAIERPDPTTLLVDWLRGDAVGLTGTKLSCGEGGCGACTVMLSRWDAARRRVEETAVNACLRPLVSLDGAMITTTEGIGSTRETLDPVQYRIAAFNGSQCGYCTPGFVMTMFTYLRTHPRPTEREIEDLFDGHICRCTGFRPILEGMRSFAVDAGPREASQTNHPCRPGIPVEQHAPGSGPALAFPEELRTYRPDAAEWSARGYTWFRPATLAEAQRLKAAHGGNSPDLKLVVGNTSVGIFKAPAYDPHVLIDVAALEELRGFRTDDTGLHVGAAESLSSVVDELGTLVATGPDAITKGFAAFRAHLLDVANLQVRNVGSIGGNVMMTRAHAETPEPFPSDVYLVLATLGASLTVASESFVGGARTYPIMELPAPADLPPDAIARSIHLPYSREADEIETFKVSYREQDSHAIVNAAFRVSFEPDGTVRDATLIFNGLANLPSPMTRTEALLAGARWDDATLQRALDVITEEVAAAIRPLPGTNFLPAGYREALAESLFYKYFLHVALRRFPGEVQPVNRSGGERDVRPISRGTQDVTVYPSEAPLGEPILKTTAFIQASGEQKYTQDLPLSPHGYDAAYVLSTRAKATFRFRGGVEGVEQTLRERFPGIVALVTAADIPGKTQVGLGDDDPIFALNGEVVSWGQPIGLVVAADRWTAQRAATFVQDALIEYDDEPPVLTIDQALALPRREGLFKDQPKIGDVHIPFIRRKGSDEKWLRRPERPMKGCVTVEGEMANEGQAHFYMETQACLAIPGEQGRMTVYSGTQQGASVQGAVASVLGVGNSNIVVLQRPLGGGFGGKQFRPSIVAPAVAVAAWKLDRPVRLALDRNTDMATIGKRHPYQGRFVASVTEDGLIKGYRVQLYSNGGMSHDASFPVMDLSQQHSDGAYFVPTWESRGEVARTNNASNTAFRSFGVTQATLVVEEAIEKIAHTLGLRAEDVRGKNMYEDGTPRKSQTTPYGEKLNHCNLKSLWRRLMRTSDFERRRAEVDAFNRGNRWRKRGLTMIPLKYGVGYQPRLLDQGIAMVIAYAADGTVMLQHGGAESGQGIDTKMQQIAAHVLGIDMAMIQVAQTSTAMMPNATATAASSGSDLFGGAVNDGCLQLRRRLEAFLRKTNAVKGWRTHWKQKWPEIVGAAYAARVSLIAEGFYRTPFIGDVEGRHSQGRAFLYFIFAAAATEVEIDVLTGESQILRADILYDAGHSLNPCLDVGQIEGGFVQGSGLMTTEQLMYEPDGRLYSNGTWEYKPPTSKSIPIDFRVTISRGGRPNKDDAAVAGSRALGEPPFVLSTSVFFAIKQAIMAARRDQGDDSWFTMTAPATVGRIREHCRVDRRAMRL
jgi:xanthine dehydrogenase/oxidase